MITFLIIHILIPVIGLVVFLFLAKRMTQADLPGGLVLELFLLFATYGGLLLVVLTSLFWQWSDKVNPTAESNPFVISGEHSVSIFPIDDVGHDQRRYEDKVSYS